MDALVFLLSVMSVILILQLNSMINTIEDGLGKIHDDIDKIYRELKKKGN